MVHNFITSPFHLRETNSGKYEKKNEKQTFNMIKLIKPCKTEPVTKSGSNLHALLVLALSRVTRIYVVGLDDE